MGSTDEGELDDACGPVAVLIVVSQLMTLNPARLVP